MRSISHLGLSATRSALDSIRSGKWTAIGPTAAYFTVYLDPAVPKPALLLCGFLESERKIYQNYGGSRRCRVRDLKISLVESNRQIVINSLEIQGLIGFCYIGRETSEGRKRLMDVVFILWRYIRWLSCSATSSRIRFCNFFDLVSIHHFKRAIGDLLHKNDGARVKHSREIKQRVF